MSFIGRKRLPKRKKERYIKSSKATRDKWFTNGIFIESKTKIKIEFKLNSPERERERERENKIQVSHLS